MHYAIALPLPDFGVAIVTTPQSGIHRLSIVDIAGAVLRANTGMSLTRLCSQ